MGGECLRRALDKVRLDAVAVPAGPEFSGRRAALASLLLLASGLAGWKFSRS